jgi:vacuolar-type H+-ATPase subunit H
METIIWLIGMIAVAFSAFFLGLMYTRKYLHNKIREEVTNDILKAEKSAEEIIASAKNDASAIVRQAKIEGKESAHKIVDAAERDAKKTRDELKRIESRLDKREKTRRRTGIKIVRNSSTNT